MCFASAQELPFTHFTPSDQVYPLPSASVQKITQDHLGYIWFGFYSTGVTRYDGHSMENYTEADGLGDLTIRELAEDGSHHLWIGSEAGLVVSAQPLDAYDSRTRAIRLAGRRRAAPAMRAPAQLPHHQRDGSVWAGTQSGVTRYRIEATVD